MWIFHLGSLWQNHFFFFESAMNKYQDPLQFPQSSNSLFAALVVKKPTAVSKSGMDLFIMNNNFSVDHVNVYYIIL